MRIILHSGTTKTGSTALQLFFASNRNLLAEKGIKFYEPLYRYVPWKGPGNGDVMLYMAYDKLGVQINPEHQKQLIEERKKLAKDLSIYDTLLFSFESIWRLSLRYDGFWEAIKESLVDLLGNSVELYILAYLRRQDNWVFSNWKQSAKSIIYHEKNQFKQYLTDEATQKMLDHASNVKRIKKALGKESILLRRYETERLVENNIFHDFIDAINLKWTNDYSIPTVLVNPSITLEAAEAAVFINRTRFNELSNCSDLTLATVLFSKLYPERHEVYPLTYNERTSLINRYTKDNNDLAKEYLGEDTFFSSTFGEYELRSFDSNRASKNADTLLKLSRLSKEGRALIESAVLK